MQLKIFLKSKKKKKNNHEILAHYQILFYKKKLTTRFNLCWELKKSSKTQSEIWVLNSRMQFVPRKLCASAKCTRAQQSASSMTPRYIGVTRWNQARTLEKTAGLLPYKEVQVSMIMYRRQTWAQTLSQAQNISFLLLFENYFITFLLPTSLDIFV